MRLRRDVRGAGVGRWVGDPPDRVSVGGWVSGRWIQMGGMYAVVGSWWSQYMFW